MCESPQPPESACTPEERARIELEIELGILEHLRTAARVLEQRIQDARQRIRQQEERVAEIQGSQ